MRKTLLPSDRKCSVMSKSQCDCDNISEFEVSKGLRAMVRLLEVAGG